MVPPVEDAIRELRACFDGCKFKVVPDAEGGALVFIEEIILVEPHPYVQNSTWVGFRLNFQLPYADVYPVFVTGDLARKDGKALGEAMSVVPDFEGRKAVQISRRSNRRNAEFDTPAIKIQKVIRWMRTRP